MQNSFHDEIEKGFQAIGEFGPYQLVVLLMVGFTGCISAITTYSYVFIAASPEFRCASHQSFNDTHQKQNHLSFMINYLLIKKSNDECFIRNNNTNTTYACNSWIFSNQYYGKTIVTDWKLVCDNESIKSTFSTIFFCGMYGVVVCGILSDKIGRKKIAYAFIVMNALVCALTAILTNIQHLNLNVKMVLYGFLQFLTAVFANFYTVAVVLAIEIIGPSKRILATNIIYYFYILGEFITLLICYFIRDYNYVYICMASLMSLYVFYFWYVPESPRWCLTKGENKKAYNVFKRIAESNNRSMPDVYESLKTMDVINIAVESSNTYSIIQTLKLLCKSKSLPIRSIAIAFNWLTNNFVYYGISLGTGDLVGNPYLNFSLFASVELLSILCTQYAFDKFGRKKPYIINMLISAIALLLVIAVPKSMPYLITALALIGKFTISFTYNGVYLLTSEMYPTVIRNTTLSVCQSIARLGSIITPYISLLGTLYWFPLPFIIYGACALVSSILAILFIPETKNTELPETIENIQ